MHLNALPQFLSPLASAVALAGQDISLMRRVLALVATTPDAYLCAATGRATVRWGRGCAMFAVPLGVGGSLHIHPNFRVSGVQQLS